MRLSRPSLAALLLPLTVFAQDPDRSRVERLERESDPPAAIHPRGTSPATVVSIGPYTSYQVNVNSGGNNIVGDAANEPSITIDPNNPNRMAIGWRQFNSITSNFRQAGWAYTTNGGTAWTFPGVLENNVFRSDPVLDSDINGKFYYLSLNNSFFCDIFRSLNQGVTWAKVAPAVGGDKEWMIVDRTNGPGQGFIYQIWSTAGNNYGGRQFSRSTNGGSTWLDPINIPLQPVWGVMDIAPNGNLYICGSDGDAEFYFVRSSNAKNSAVTPSFDLSRTLSLGGTVGFGQVINPDGLSGQANIVTDKSTTPMAGNIYILSSVRVNSSNPLDVRFARSVDGGSTWSASKRINDDAPNATKYHWMAAMAIAPGGRIDVVWNDTRGGSNQFSALYYSCSFDGGDTWVPNIQVSPTFNHTLGYPNQNKMGDYLGLLSDDGGGRVAYTATFNGEEDVYYLRIPAPDAVSPFSVIAENGRILSGGVNELEFAENTHLVADQGPSLIGPKVALVLKGSTSVMEPAKLRFKLEASAFEAGLTQRIELFNFESGVYETVDQRSASTSDSIALADPSGALARFVDQGSGEVRARVSYFRSVPRSRVLLRVRVDQAQWVAVGS